MANLFFGGVEGGATHSKAVICDANGSIIAKAVGPGTNHWVVGIPEVARRISNMIIEAKNQANIDQSIKLRSLGLSLSGCEQEATNKILEQELLNNHPEIAESYHVCSDTLGSIFATSSLGGVVLIAGTGSNALLRNPDGKTFTCGGWGNVLADEGAAWWIAHKAVKTCFDHDDKLELSPYNTSAVWEQVKKHFEIETRHDLLDHCYAKFDKAFFASLTMKLSEIASEGDELSLHLFNEAGRYLAKATQALLPHVSEKLLKNGTLNIVCVGSVWKSWHLLKKGYEREISKTNSPFGLNLITLTQAMAIGAAYIAADSIEFDLPRDYSHNYEVFQYFPPNYGKSIQNGNHSLQNGVGTKLSNGTPMTNGHTTNGVPTKGKPKNKIATINGSPSRILVNDG